MAELQMFCCWYVEWLVATFVNISWVGGRVTSAMENVTQRFDVLDNSLGTLRPHAQHEEAAVQKRLRVIIKPRDL